MKNVSIVTYGCSLNNADSEIIASNLDRSRFNLVENENNSDIVIINTCTVKGPTDTKIKRHIKDLKEKGKKVVLSGCFVQAQPEKVKEKYGVPAIGTSQFLKINKVLTEGGIHIEKGKIPQKTFRFDEFREIVPIARGCLGNCSYCITKLARGKLDSTHPDKLIKRIKKVINEGVTEIWLTAEDNFIYGLDKDYSIYDLLSRIEKIKGDFFIRIGMANPKAFLRRKEEVVKSLKLMNESEKFYKFVHLPIQSANNRVLNEMRRGYSFEEVYDLFKLVKKLNFSISTDIICGFPTETEKEFEESINFIKELKPDFLNISRYWPRPKTDASKMKYDGGITKKRSRKITKIYNQISKEINKNWEGKTTKILLNDKKSNALVGRNIYYKPIVIKNKEFEKNNIDRNKMLGKFCKVKIIDSSRNYLEGKLIEKIK